MKKLILITCLLLSIYTQATTNKANSVSEITANVIYYSKPKGALNDITTWGKNKDGSGEQPKGFTSSNVSFCISNGNNQLKTDWRIKGDNNALIIGDDVLPASFTISTNITLTCGTIYVMPNSSLNIEGNIQADKLISSDNGSVFYTSSSSQNIIPGVYYMLSVAEGDKQMNGNVTVSQSLYMDANIQIGTGILTLGTNTSTTGLLKYTSGSISGIFVRWFAPSINDEEAGLFPLGAGGYYRPVTIQYTTAPQAGGKIQAQFISADPGTKGLPLSEDGNILDKGANDGYWKLSFLAGIAGGEYTLSASPAGFEGITDLSQLRMVCRVASEWIAPGSSETTEGVISSPVIKRKDLSISGVVDIGVTKEVINPLPVKLIILSVQQEKEQAMLSWQTASEQNSDHFSVERSLDTKEWATLQKVKAAGHSSELRNYFYADDISSFLEQETKTLYYRLNQVDADGKSTYSKTITLDIKPLEKSTIILYPLPLENTLTVSISTREDIKHISIIDMTGKEVLFSYSEHINVSSLATGMYLVKVSTDKVVYYQKISK